MARMLIDDLLVIDTHAHADERGTFRKLYSRADLAARNIEFSVDQTAVSRNPRLHTLRGLHWQRAPHHERKLVEVLEGAIFDVVVDLRPHSVTYGHWQATTLAADDARAVLVPAGCAHGFLTLAPDTTVVYHLEGEYASVAARGLRYDDATLGIEWPASPAVISPQDSSWPAWRATASAR